ncbi:MAG TPA: hypothetical protein VGU26_10000 [Gaiellaceae bacterium]|nr:hypothetical protein [Gaiellaceae bacterium]
MLGEQLLDGADRGLGRTGGEVPHHEERAARAEDTGDLAHRAFVGETVERLRCEDRVHRAVRERDLLGRPADRLGVGAMALEEAAHGVSRLDGDDAAEGGDEQARQLARACPQVENRRAWRQVGDLADLGRPAGTATLVVERPSLAATDRHAPARRHRPRRYRGVRTR